MSIKTKQIPVRLDEDTWRLLKRVCNLRGETLSTFMRRALRRELARLGVLEEEACKILEK
ncbi:MAG: ribbon-helix-helix protein, CopG family [Thaumarchaeota archaeon]|jgi:uncharacterized protein (DUF1778 family)|nr:ribbon-helix-helix protein, CopG family [Candidatus Geocrenenecus arthurdayi]